MTTNQGTGTFVRGHRRVASEWSAVSTTSSNESEPLKRDENAEIRVVIFVEAQNEFNWFKNVFLNGKYYSHIVILLYRTLKKWALSSFALQSI